MKHKIRSGIFLAGAASLVSSQAQAHCPLCTAGAGAAAGLAAFLGVNNGAIGVFLGAFAMALGLWTPRLIKKRYLPGQNILLFWGVYLSTLLPLLPFTEEYTWWLVSWWGDYGSLFNRTYLINLFIVGAAIGSLIVYITPWFSAQVTRFRGGKMLRFQGIILTFLFLATASFLMQVL